MNPPLRDRGSFRDPAGQVRERDGRILREVFQAGRRSYEVLVSTGLCESLVSRALMVSHAEVEAGPWNHPDTWRVLEPERVPFLSYPFEWCFGQLRDAAMATLDIQEEALKVGLSLKDAAPENIQFVRGRPILIDTLSFEPARPVWTAYYQFCRRFLAPLVLTVHGGPEFIRSLAVERDGISLDVASSLLPWHTWLRPSVALHVHIHAKADRRALQARAADDQVKDTAPRRRQQLALVDSLRRAVDRLRWSPPGSEWTRYEKDRPTYRPEGWASREEILRNVLNVLRPSTVWDIGAALGHASRVAAAAGAEAIAFDSDPSCVELMWRRVQQDKEQRLLPLVQDLLRPTPRLGWGEQELLSLSDRGPADLLMCLGLFHHLNIRGGVPAELVFDYLAKLGRAALVEFIPPTDPVVVEWCGKFGRSALKEDEFRAAAARHYARIERCPIAASDRVLYLCEERVLQM